MYAIQKNPEDNKPFQFGTKDDNDKLLSVLDSVLQEHGMKPKEDDERYIDLKGEVLDHSFLSTVMHAPQTAHIDSKRELCTTISSKEELAYSCSIPLTCDGMFLGVCGEDPFGNADQFKDAVKNGRIKEKPVMVYCPYGYCILWS